MEEDELLDVVSAEDKVISTIWRSEYDRLISNNLGYLRAIDMFIINDDSKLWVPKRPAHKRIAPNGLDYSAGGHVGSGESYLTAALREIEEELNLTLSEADLQFVTVMRSEDVKYLRAIYVYHSNQSPDYNPHDFVSAEWLSPDELLTKLASGVAAKGSIRETVVELQARGLC